MKTPTSPKSGAGRTKYYWNNLARMEMDPCEKLVLKIRADVETQPIEVNVQSAGV